jgi:hypothetical protein
MAILNRDGLLAVMALRTQDVSLASGDVVRMRGMTAAERISLSNAAMVDGKIDGERFSALMVAACAVDEAGNRIFADDDVPAILAGASDVFETLFGAAQTLNGMGAKAAEDAKGN